jgi:hypothetical protein
MEIVTRIGTAAVCCGLLFFLMCVVLVFGYLFNQPKKVAVASESEPPAQMTDEVPNVGTTEPAPKSSWASPPAETSGEDD